MRYALITSTAAAVLSCSHVVLAGNPAHEAYLELECCFFVVHLAAPSISRAPAPQHMTATDPSIPSLDHITMGGPVQSPVHLTTTYAAGATAPLKGARTLPSKMIVASRYPPIDKVPPTDSPEVQDWIAEVMANNPSIPLIPQTKDGSCASDPELAKQGSAAGNCWWTCGGCTRPTDITVCPDKMSWGLTYDDGPSPYTPKLLHYLDEHQLNATFYVVGSRVISRPEIVQYEYMKGHEVVIRAYMVALPTYLSHQRANYRRAWVDPKGDSRCDRVSPLTMRPPYGDIDDRVRAIAMAMDLTPVIWTGVGKDEFDTSDWRIPGGTSNGTYSYSAFNKILENATTLDTGFIVLQHDLYQETVDLAVGYILPDALAHQPKFTLSSVSHCLHQPLEDAYIETNTNETIRTTAGGGIGLRNSGFRASAPIGFAGALVGMVGVLAVLFA
ncbi:Polysaccharide deacetylase [Rhizoctonia solani]|uniref:chitin deacetylase n=1 Tax=Rhizoctonia solani TaxID=456999 RepID=A0A8H7I3N3_9AGAM|nr:Polysaccharide deacetylase [Rhizoctonia solani]